MVKLEELNKGLAKNNIERVYTMNEFNEMLSGLSPLEVVSRTEGEQFDSRDDYFIFDGVRNVQTFESLEEVLANYEDVK